MSLRARVGRLARFEVLGLTALIWFLALFLRYAFPPLFGPLQGIYGVSNADLGLAFTALMTVYAAMQFPSGLLADRFGSVRVITIGACVAAGGALVLVVDSPFPVLVGAMLLIGAGTGVHKTVAVRLFSRVYADQTGRVMGVFDTVGSLAGAVAPPAVVFFIGLPGPFGAGWRTVFLLGAVAGAGLAVTFAVRSRNHLPDGAGAGAGAGTGAGDGADTQSATDDGADPAVSQYVALFRRPRFSTFVVVTLLHLFATSGLVAFLPLYLSTEGGLSTSTAGLVYSVYFLGNVSQLATGEAGDRVGELPVAAFALGLASVAIVALLLVPVRNPVVFGVIALGLGLGLNGYRPVRETHLVSLVPDSITGGGLGIVRTMFMGSGAVSPAVVGFLSETAGFRAAFWLLAACVALGVGLSVILLVTDDEP